MDIVAEFKRVLPLRIRDMLKEGRDILFVSLPPPDEEEIAVVTNVVGDYIRIFTSPTLLHVYKEKPRDDVLVHAVSLKGEQFFLDTKEEFYVPDRLPAALLEVLTPEEFGVSPQELSEKIPVI